MIKVKRVFKVNGKPFYPLGSEASNSSGYNEQSSETAFKAIKLMHGNTLEIPIYWDEVEPEEGVFNFASIDSLIASARRYEVKLLLMWFATWKNANMDYAPEWVKTNPQRFKRVLSRTGDFIWVLSSHCQANLEADKRAFTALCSHLKAKDRTEQTVIGLTVQNESGIMGSDRDYGPEAQAAFDGPVPSQLVTAMKKYGRGPIYNQWQKTGGKESGNWTQLFGWEAGEFMTAWSIAKFIDNIAASGKAVYDIPMYVNVWLMEQNWWPIPGESYPSGAAVSKMMDLYKWFTPHVDMISPDAHIAEADRYKAVCASYARPDNPFFMPETGAEGDSHAWNMFRSIADYNSIGEFFFGAERVITEDGQIRPEAQMIVDSVRCTAAVIPLLLKYQGTGKIHAVIQEDLSWTQLLDLDGYSGLIEFGERTAQYPGKDWQHTPPGMHNRRKQTDTNRGRGLVIQAKPHEFYLVGANYRLLLRPEPSTAMMPARLAIADYLPKLPGSCIVRVDEGHFNQDGEFIIDKQRNGDEIDPAVWVEPDVGVVRLLTCD